MQIEPLSLQTGLSNLELKQGLVFFNQSPQKSSERRGLAKRKKNVKWRAKRKPTR